MAVYQKQIAGKFFIGGGEDVTGENYEPDEEDGIFINYLPGNYLVQAWEKDGKCALNISATDKEAINSYVSSPKIA